MPWRFSGQLKINVQVTDLDYQVIVAHQQQRWRTHVGQIAGQVIDSPSSIDGVARAALSFLADEEERGVTDVDLICHADWDDDGAFVTRARL